MALHQVSWPVEILISPVLLPNIQISLPQDCYFKVALEAFDDSEEQIKFLVVTWKGNH